MEHGYTWADVVSRPTSSLQAGDVVIAPGIGTAYWVSPDGNSVRGHGWLPLDGSAYAIASRDGAAITFEDAAGITRTRHLKDVRVLRVKREDERP